MAKLTREDVLKLARLSKIELDEDEVASLADELSQILGYVDKLSEADVKGLEPTAQVTGLNSVTRPDEAKDYGYQPADLLKQVPAVKDHQIKVKRMIV